MKIEIDESRFPILWAMYPEQLSDDDLNDYLRRSAAYLERQVRHVMVIDLTHMGKSLEKHRRMIAAWTRDHENELRAHRAGTVFVSPLTEQKSTVSGVFWHAVPPYAYFLAYDAGSALRWAEKRLAAGGGGGKLAQGS